MPALPLPNCALTGTEPSLCPFWLCLIHQPHTGSLINVDRSLALCSILTTSERNNWIMGWKGPLEKVRLSGLQTAYIGVTQTFPGIQGHSYFEWNQVPDPSLKHVPSQKLTCLRKYLRVRFSSLTCPFTL